MYKSVQSPIVTAKTLHSTNKTLANLHGTYYFIPISSSVICSLVLNEVWTDATEVYVCVNESWVLASVVQIVNNGVWVNTI